ncbi:MAG: arsenosugar biosynthesis radical SAM (seleno)protein ArsS [Saprospiraceae bacterium]
MSIHQKTKSLSSKGSQLSNTFYQLEVLNGNSLVEAHFPPFALKAADAGFFPMRPARIEVFQINIGKLCNQTCAHCHVDAGPDKKVENMSKATLEKCLAILTATDIPTVDITGGAPEMNAHFRWFVEECRKLGKNVIVRCNLTIIQANKKYHDLPDFFAKNQIQVVSSLPYFSKVRTDAQRGDGVFEDSIKALQLLNAVGYGVEGSGLTLDLVYNPSGAFLPGHQEELEREFKSQLLRRYQIVFNQLFVITNMPISRFLDYLLESDNYEEYMQSLVSAFNPAVVQSVMCRTMISVSWDGYLYDCDFNQMLDLKINSSDGKRPHLDDFDMEHIENRVIVLNQHCYGCTAGSGSSCGGELS